MAKSGSMLMGCLWIIIAFCLAPPGCGRRDFGWRRDFVDEPGDLILDLGEGVGKRFVYIDELSLFVGRFEVSNAEYRRFRPGHSSGMHRQDSLDADDQPVVNVSWKDANAYCDWLNEKFAMVDEKELRFRLPTVEEWEAFARCGDDREYPWGDAWPPPEDRNYYGSENPGPGAKLEGDHKYQVSSPVYKSGMNEWRLFGVGGNVWEWCKDVEDNEQDLRVLKGASWVDCHPLFLGIERSRMYPPDYRAVNMGFRVVAEVVTSPQPPP